MDETPERAAEGNMRGGDSAPRRLLPGLTGPGDAPGAQGIRKESEGVARGNIRRMDKAVVHQKEPQEAIPMEETVHHKDCDLVDLNDPDGASAPPVKH